MKTIKGTPRVGEPTHLTSPQAVMVSSMYTSSSIK